MITEVSFWNTALNPAEINLIKNSIGKTHLKYNNLVAYYPMLVNPALDTIIVLDLSLKGNYADASRKNLQDRLTLQYIPGYNSIDNFNKSWYKNQMLMSTTDTLRFITDVQSAGIYQLVISYGNFIINDDFYLTLSGELVVGTISSDQITNQQAIPAMLTATPPAVGNPPYHYQWESSTGGTAFTKIPGATSVNYQPGGLETNTRYRQLQSAESPGCSAYTNVITITVIPIYLAVNNKTIANGENKCYNAADSMTVGGIGTPFLVQSGGSVKLIAGQKITLKPGTRVVPGGYLHGYITSTGENCYNQVLAPPAGPVQLLKETMGLSKISTDNIFDCYPNPNTGRFNLRLSTEPGETPAVVRIYNLMGMEILTRTIYSGKLHEISLEGQVAGIYLVSVLQNEKSGIRKVIVNR
jgi:hypothetical protein